MKLERWAKKLLKSSSSLPHSSKPCPTDATPPSRHSLEQSYPSSWSTQSACTRRRHKTFFGFSTRNASLGSHLSVAYGSGMTDLSRKHHHISSTNLSSTTINSLEGGAGKDREDVVDENDKEPETTTLYYHPPPHAWYNQQQIQVDETREDGEQRRLMQVQLDEEAKKLARRRLARLGHQPEARASAKDVSSSSQRRPKVCHNVDGESRGVNPRPVGQTTSRGVHSTRNRSESLPPPPCLRFMSKANTGTPGPDLLDFLDLRYLPYQPGHGTQQKQKQKQELPQPEPSSLVEAYPTDRQGGDDLPGSVRHSIDTINNLRASIVGLTAAFGELTPATLSLPNTSLHPGDFDGRTSCVFGATGSSSQGRTCPCNAPVDSDAVELPLPLGLSHPIATAPVLKQLGSTLSPLSAPQRVEFKAGSSSSTIAKVQRSNDPNYEQLVKVVHTLNSSVDDLSRKIATMMMLELTTEPHKQQQQQQQSRHISEEEDSSFQHCSPETTFFNGPDVEVEPLHSAPTKLSACCSSKTTISTASPSRNHPQGVIVRPDWFPPPPRQALPSIPVSEPSVATTARHPRRSHVQPPLQQQQQHQQQQRPSPVVTTILRKQTDTTKAALTLGFQHEEAKCQTALSTFLPPKHTTTSSPYSPSSSQVVTPFNGCTCQPLGETETRRLGQAANKAMAVTTATAAGGEDRSPELIHVIGLIEARLTVLRSEWPQLFFRDSYGHQTSRTTYGSNGSGSGSAEEEEEEDDGLDKPLDTQLQAMVTRLQSELAPRWKSE